MRHLFAILFICVCLALDAQVTFSGNTLPVLTVKPEASSGLDNIYVLNGVTGVSATFNDGNSSTSWQKYSSLGGGYAQDIPGVTTTLSQVEGDMGYIIENGDKRYYFWVVDYAKHPLNLRGLDLAQSDCSSVTFNFTGDAGEIKYYTINGREVVIDRQIKLSYNTQEYDNDSQSYGTIETSQNYACLGQEVHAPAPLCDTQFVLQGDVFARQWKRGQQLTTETVNATAVDCRAVATQTPREAQNESQGAGGGDALGGSAPAEITFKAAVTEAAIFTEWQVATDPAFENIDLRFQETEVTHTFRDMGDYYARFVCANSDGSCEQTSEPFQITIGESMLQCPNAFSPGASEGVNDEWKVAYKSIVEFDCHIFNRNGIEIASFTDPSQGWDGKYKGKLVPTGAYFYVIKARGADGKQYNLGGDINIVNFK